MSLSAIAAVTLAASGCGDSSEETDTAVAKNCSAKIGFLGALTGVAAPIGTSVRNSVELAIEQFTEQNPTCVVELVEKDAPAALPSQAPKPAQEFADDPSIIGVVGPTSSTDGGAIGEIMSKAGLPMIAPAADSTELSQQGWTTFHRSLGTTDAQGAAAGRYIKNILYLEKVFLVHDTRPYGVGLADGLRKALTPVDTATIEAYQTDFSALVSRITSSGADAVYVGAFAQEAGLLLNQLRAAGSTAAFASSGGSKADDFVKLAGATEAEGTIITCSCAPPDKTGGTYYVDYKARFNSEPTEYSPEGFDAANILLAGIKAGKTTRVDLEAYVDAYEGKGVTGEFRFTPEGDVDPDLVSLWAYAVRSGKILPDQKMFATVPK
ncbi:MAG: branched-chain amino acid ABC transporter substrate-binding protein [Longispora sp.]|nr:branched-chain amino acid ABC transporter substrate-binding protein [Longispora sp. (in: high G+C Gram-positive bacteria)]